MPRSRRSAGRQAGALLAALALVGFVVALVSGTPAHANPRALGQASPTSCPTTAYGTSTTIANCGTTTTTAPSGTFTLTISYHGGHVKWQACGTASEAGSTVQLYINGQAATGQGGSGQIQPDGCTTDPDFPVCLVPADYTAEAVDAQFGLHASGAFTVTKSQCQNPQSFGATGSGSGNGNGNGSHGSLAFTGTDIALMVVGALILMAAGFGVVQVSRRRRHAA